MKKYKTTITKLLALPAAALLFSCTEPAHQEVNIFGENGNPPSGVPTDGNGNSGSGDEGGVPGGGSDAGEGGIGATGPTPPVITVGPCGSIAPSTTIGSADVNNPLQAVAGEVYSGVVDVDSSNNVENYWTMNLEPGSYWLVWEIDDGETGTRHQSFLNTYLEFYDSSTGEFTEFSEIFDTSFRVREDAFFDVLAPTTYLFRIRNDNTAGRYHFGFFENGTPIPSPQFSESVSYTHLTLPTTPYV